MVFVFTADEYVDMLLVYGECRKNCRDAARLYQERFPNRRAPSQCTFRKLETRMRTGTFPNTRHEDRRRYVSIEDNIINVLAYVYVNPRISIRELADELGISRSSIHRILKNHKYHPFKIHLVQALRPTDYDRRLQFIAEILVMSNDNPRLLYQICWSDESRFHNNGVVNKHNAHYWSVDNPHWMQETNSQQMWGINVWCAVFNGSLIGPHFYEGHLTGERYLQFLQNSLPDLLENIPLAQRQSMIWQQDGAPPHNCLLVTNYLNQVFPNRWIGTNGPIRWPPRSPDLTPLDFFIWGYLKDSVYTRRPQNLEDLKAKIREACNTLTQQMLLMSCTRTLLSRLEACVQNEGRQFEALL